MSIEKYFKRLPTPQESVLPNPRGSLSLSIPPKAIAAANRAVTRVMQQQSSAKGKRRGKYNIYSSELRAEIGRYAVQHGNASARRVFSTKLGVRINNSTISGIKKAYLAEREQKRARDENEDEIAELPEKKRGRHVLLGERLDGLVQKYVLQVREGGGAINTAMVVAGAMGIVESLDRTRLVENGGDIFLSRSWAKSLLKRMKFTKRRATTKCGISPQVFREVKTQFLQDVIDIVKMEDIPPQLIFNWDQTGLHLVPSSSWTMARKGSKRVEMKGMEDKRQITAVFCGTLCGEFLPIQLIYTGKTDRCHPRYSFPADWSITHSHNHWSNESTMLEYIEDVIVPYVKRVREDLDTDEDQAALALFDHFKGQLTANVTSALEKHNIQSALIPATCTDRLQPLDISVNKSAKVFLRAEFQNWYAAQISSQQAVDGTFNVVDMSGPRMKCVGAQWLVRLYENFLESPEIIINGFLSSGIPQSIDSNKPYVKEADKSTSDKKEDKSANAKEVDESTSDSSSEEYSSEDSEDDTFVTDSEED